MLPRARDYGLRVRDEGDVVVVHDLSRTATHRLARATAAVWRLCNGRRTVPEIARAAARVLTTPSDELLVWLAIQRLEEANLLDEGEVRREPISRAAGASTAA